MAKILVVEDNQPTAELIEMVLRSGGHELVFTADGSEALGLAKQHRPQLVLLDVMLPGADGFTVQGQLLEDDETRSVPIVMMTSKAQMEEVFKTAPNVAAFIAKPFSVKDFVSTVDKALRR